MTTLGESGQTLWDSITAEYELEQHEEALLLAACRCADLLDRLAEDMRDAPLTVTNHRGDEVGNPLFVEHRLQAANLSKLLASLRLPTGDEADRPQRRGGARGSYGIRGAV